MTTRLAEKILRISIVCGVALAAGCGDSAAADDLRPPTPTASTDRPASTNTSQDRQPSGQVGQWANWRGPDSRGIAHHTRLPDEWPKAALEPQWKVRLQSGWSSPVVGDGRVYATDRAGNTERVLAFDAANGRPLWTRTNPVDFDPHAVGRRHGNGPKATPIFDEGRLYSVGIAGWLQCLDARDGRLLWKVNFPQQFGQAQPLRDGRAFVNGETNVIVPIGEALGAPVPLFGHTGSPVLAGELLITPVGGQRGGTIVAFDKTTGKVVWKSLHENVSYSSPVVANPGGVAQVVVMTGPRVVGLDLRDGQLLWSHPFQIQYDESISTPVVDGDLVLVTGDRQPLTALRITRQGPALTAKVAWENHDLSSYLSSMLIHDRHVYGMNDGGEFQCAALADGKARWFGGSHGMYCTPVLAAGKLLCLNERGRLLVLAADPTSYRELATNQLADEASWTVPAVVGSRIFVRSAESLRCFELGK